MSVHDEAFREYATWLAAQGVQMDDPAHVAQLLSAVAQAEDVAREAQRKERAALVRISELKADVESLRAELRAARKGAEG